MQNGLASAGWALCQHLRKAKFLSLTKKGTAKADGYLEVGGQVEFPLHWNTNQQSPDTQALASHYYTYGLPSYWDVNDSSTGVRLPQGQGKHRSKPSHGWKATSHITQKAKGQSDSRAGSQEICGQLQQPRWVSVQWLLRLKSSPGAGVIFLVPTGAAAARVRRPSWTKASSEITLYPSGMYLCCQSGCINTDSRLRQVAHQFKLCPNLEEKWRAA